MNRVLGAIVALLCSSSIVAAAPAGLDVGLFRPPATSGGILGVDAAFTAGHLAVAGSLFLDYQKDALVEHLPGGDARVGLRHGLGLQAAASVSFWRRLEIGLVMPAVLYQTGDAFSDGSRAPASAAGDLRLEAKAHLGAIPLGIRGRALGFAIALGLGLPTGSRAAFSGQGGVSFWPRVLVTALARPIEVTVEIGFLVRGARALLDLDVAQQLRFGVGARVALYRGLGLACTIAGLVPLDGTHGTSATPIELLAGPDYRLAKVPIDVVVAAGRGLTDGIGAPDVRAVLAIRYQPRAPIDRDGDGVPDRDDRCPKVRGAAALGGCPDRDHDGVADPLDRCPDVPGVVDRDGCPDPDRDGDGVVDRLDRCPDVAGPARHAGCPELDGDKDGVLDELDRCPTVPGDAAHAGCPPPVVDTDGDGIPDDVDRCPREKENFNGVEDDDGCPDKGRELAVLTETQIEIREQVFFETGKAKIQQASFPLLNAVGKILALHPELVLVRVEGHTDSLGRAATNLKLSRARAEAVRAYLVDVYGIAPGRLIAEGFGATKPIADNATTAGRSKNRRSAFVLVERAPSVPGGR